MHRSFYDIIFGKISFLIVILVLSGCQEKELPKAPDDSPVFYFKGRANDVNHDFQAGNDDYYMYTEFESQGGVILKKGELRKQTCIDCGPGLQISFHSKAGETLQAGKQTWLTISKKVSDWNVREFHAIESGDNNTYEWDFGDGNTSTEQSPTHEYSSPGTYEVCLSVIGTSDCRSRICNDVIIDTTDLNGSFSSEMVSKREIEFQAVKKNYSQYNWDFGDGNSATGSSATHTYNYAGFYEVCLTVTDDKGQQSTFCQEISANSGNYCLARYTYQPDYDTIPSEQGVELIWTDKSGTKYHSSAINKLHKNEKLIIQQISDYEENGTGQPTKAIELTFDATLYSVIDDQDSIHVRTTEVSKIAVATGN